MKLQLYLIIKPGALTYSGNDMRQTLKVQIEGHAVKHLTYNIIACRKRKRQIFKSEYCLSNKATFC